MNRLTKMGISTLTVAATAASALGVVSAASAGAATASTNAGSRPAAMAKCVASHKNYPFPTRAETFKALTAGSVTIAPVNSGTIKVTKVHTAKGWHSYLDSGSGSSVDVYFRSGRHMVKFEAEINDAGGLTVTLTKCG